MTAPDDDLPAIRQGLADRATELFERLWDKPTKRGRNEWRWGRKGSLVLYLRGRGGPHWCSYESDQRGDMLAAIQHALGTDFIGALEWARDWLGMPQREQRRQRRPEPPPCEGKPADFDAEQAAKARRAAELSAAAGPIAGTLAERYLHEHRGIAADAWPDALGFTDAATVWRCTGWYWWRWPALLVRATNAAGTVTGVQLVALQADGSAARHWEHDGKLKLSFGTLAGSAVRLPGDDRALLLAEGPETSLSCWWATRTETWANLGSIVRAPLADVPIGRLIVICADDDARNAHSNKALRDAIRGWRREGRRVVLVKPHALTQRDKSDFNDTLRAEGPKAVRNRILAAIEDRPQKRVLLPVAEARERAADLINAAIDALLSQQAPQNDGGARGLDLNPYSSFASETLNDDIASFKVLRLPTGIGKTEITIRRIVAEAVGGAKVIYLTPTHKLNGEIAERIAAEANRLGVTVPVEVFRGRSAERPDDPNRKMCSEYKTIRMSQAAKVDTADVCTICPRRNECPYIAQFERSASIWIGARDLAWHKMPAPLKGADLVIIDEEIATSGLIGFSGEPRLITERELDRIPPVESIALEADIRAKLMPTRWLLTDALHDHPDSGLLRDRLIAVGLTAEAARIAQGLEWLATYRVDIRGLSWKRAKEVLEDAASRNLMVSQFAALWHAVEELLTEGPPESGRAVFGDHKIEGHVVRSIRQYGVERIAADWSKTPTLHIDATVDMELLRHRVPHAELIGEIEAAAPHVRIVQYPDRAFGKIALRNERLLFRVWDWCIAYAAQRGGDWGIIVPKDAETAIVAAREMPSFIKLHHFGALRGLDELKNVRGLIIVGRPMEGPDGVERIAGALSGRAVEPIAGDWYPAELVQLRAHDGGVASVEADRHPHPMAEAVRRSIAEGEVLQAIGRARGLNRKAENPVEIVLLGNVPVPGVIPDELRQWEGPNVDDEIFARFGAALESAGDAAAVASLKRDAVRVARQRLGTFSYKNYLYGNVPNLCSAIYQIAGPGRSRQGIVYDRRRIADCRAWLTERLGPLTYFAEIEAEQPAKPVTKVQILDIAAAPVVALGADPPFSEPVRSSDTVAARPCTWITDTSGERIQRCGELVADGRDYCPEHRHRHACAMAGVAIRPPMPVRPFPAGYAPVLMAAE